MAYDKSDWHYNGDYPKDLPPENGGTHIGMFLAWVIDNALESDARKKDSQTSLNAVRAREMTGREFLKQECDETFSEDDLNDEGNAFAKYYYESDKYYADYATTLANGLATFYHVDDNWENYQKISQTITARYEQWRHSQNKRWWKFWS